MKTKILIVIVVIILVASSIGVVMFLNNNDKSSIYIDVDLEVFGNADKDSKISADDSKLVERYISAVRDGDNDAIADLEKIMSKSFADANRDGVIDSKDVDQINGIVNNSAKKIWLLDGDGNERSVSTDVKRIGCEYYSNTELCLILGLGDKIAAVDNAPYLYKDFYFSREQQNGLVNMVNCSTPDFDFINSLDLDTYLIFASASGYVEKRDKIIDCDVLYLGLYNPDLTNTSKSNFIQGVLKAGYIFNTVDRAEEYVDWIIGYRDRLLNIANSIPENQKPVVGMSNYNLTQYFGNESINTITLYKPVDPLGQAVGLGGGHNVITDIIDSSFISNSAYGASIQIDTVFNDDPNMNVDYFFLHMVKYTYGASITAGVPEHGYITDDWSEITAAQIAASNCGLLENEKINLIAGDFRNGCTGGVLLGAYIGNIINPDHYKSIDPIKMHNEYVAWMGVNGYNVSEDGVFISPKLP
jgi:hypothetical protein